VMNNAVMNNNKMNLNKAHQVQKKTSSDADATQDQDLARVEGLHPREGITRLSALPVPPRAAQHAVRPTQLLQIISQLAK
jgi:hypothetical protein